MQGVDRARLPFRPERGGVPDPADAAALIGPRPAPSCWSRPTTRPARSIRRDDRSPSSTDLRASTATSPWCSTRPTRLPAGGRARPHGLFADPGLARHAGPPLQLLQGLLPDRLPRRRAITAGPGLMAEVEKAMDYVDDLRRRSSASRRPSTACATSALGAREHEGPEARARRRWATASRRSPAGGWSAAAPTSPMSNIRSPANARPRCPSAWPTRRILLTIPGDMFGAGQERFVRLAFANVADDKIPAVLERLERFGA